VRTPRTFFGLLLAVCLAGCASAPAPHGVPNFAVVDYNIYRGGQPTAQGWEYLKTLGVTNVVKLNDESEGSDAYACLVGMTINRFPISLSDQLFYLKHREMVWGAVDAITPHTFIHCQHGQDRTGLVVACYRIDTVGYDRHTIDAAQQEMLAHGFHKSLFGLWNFWEGLIE
jgi:hypothetical protein